MTSASESTPVYFLMKGGLVLLVIKTSSPRVSLAKECLSIAHCILELQYSVEYLPSFSCWKLSA